MRPVDISFKFSDNLAECFQNFNKIYLWLNSVCDGLVSTSGKRRAKVRGISRRPKGRRRGGQRVPARLPRGGFGRAFARRARRRGVRGDVGRGRRGRKIPLEQVPRKAAAQGRAHRRQGVHSRHRGVRAFGALSEQRYRHTFSLRGRRWRRNKRAPRGRRDVSALGHRREAGPHERDRKRNSRAGLRGHTSEKLPSRRPPRLRRPRALFALPAGV